tara:strand:- start:546 stop:1523 length:978 start_codon:yes stop_codon:yes gene_type:complete
MFDDSDGSMKLVDPLFARGVGEHIIEKYRYSRFRLHKLFSAVDARKIHLDTFIGKGEGWFFLVKRGSGAIGLLKLGRLDWDSFHFGLPMYRIEFLHCENDPSAWMGLGEEVSVMLSSFLGRGHHVDAAVDHDDYIWLNALIDAGFHLYDSKNHYVFRRHQKPISVRLPFLCRELLPDDMDAVFGILTETDFPAKFSRDPFFYNNKEKVKLMYESWVNGLVSRKQGDDPVLVVERMGQVVAFGAGATMALPPIAGGKKVCGNSLFFCKSDSAGSYPTLVHYLTRCTKNYFDALELAASITNYPAIRVIERFAFQVAGGVHSLSLKL